MIRPRARIASPCLFVRELLAIAPMSRAHHIPNHVCAHVHARAHSCTHGHGSVDVRATLYSQTERQRQRSGATMAGLALYERTSSTPTAADPALSTSTTVLVGNVNPLTRESQIWELFSKSVSLQCLECSVVTCDCSHTLPAGAEKSSEYSWALTV